MSGENIEQLARAGALAACLDEDAGLLVGFAPPVSEDEGASIGPSSPEVHVRLGVPGHPRLTLLGVAHDESKANLGSRLGELAARLDKLG
jgi:hypothetical protein